MKHHWQILLALLHALIVAALMAIVLPIAELEHAPGNILRSPSRWLEGDFFSRETALIIVVVLLGTLIMSIFFWQARKVWMNSRYLLFMMLKLLLVIGGVALFKRFPGEPAQTGDDGYVYPVPSSQASLTGSVSPSTLITSVDNDPAGRQQQDRCRQIICGYAVQAIDKRAWPATPALPTRGGGGK
jgi:hypothetical protein